MTMYYLQYWIVTMYIYKKKYISEANILFLSDSFSYFSDYYFSCTSWPVKTMNVHICDSEFF